MRPVPVALLVTLALGLSACGGGAAAPAGPAASRSSTTPSIPSVTDISGEVVVTDLAAIRYSGSGTACVALPPYAAVRRGARVRVRSDTGSLKAITELDDGRLRRQGSATRPPGCVFGFDYPGAAAGRPSYTVSVAGLPPTTVAFAELARIVVRVPASG